MQLECFSFVRNFFDPLQSRISFLRIVFSHHISNKLFCVFRGKNRGFVYTISRHIDASTPLIWPSASFSKLYAVTKTFCTFCPTISTSRNLSEILINLWLSHSLCDFGYYLCFIDDNNDDYYVSNQNHYSTLTLAANIILNMIGIPRHNSVLLNLVATFLYEFFETRLRGK